MRERVKRNFILQQGFEEPSPAICPRQYSALHFQGRVVFVCIVAGIVSHSPPLFYVLCAVLWWSALLPQLNPFDAFYNSTLGGRDGAFHLTPAPAPRRTAQSMAGAFALACGLLIHFGLSIAAYVVEGIFLAAVLALILGGLCVGSFVHYLLRGRGAFGRRTLPWGANLWRRGQGTFQIVCKNFGRTSAWIHEQRIQMQLGQPVANPDFESDQLATDSVLIPLYSGEEDRPLACLWAYPATFQECRPGRLHLRRNQISGCLWTG